jgi:signal transduction histidine kinase
LDRVHPDDRAKFIASVADLTPENPTAYLTYRMLLPNGAVVWLEKSGRAYFDEQRRMLRMIGMVADVTDRKLSEEALAAVSGRLIEAQEQERTRIARDLHDDVAQRITLLAIELDQLQQNSPGLSPELRSRMDNLRMQTSEISSDIQAMSHALHSSKLEYLGVVAAMRSFCREFREKQKVEIDFVSRDLPTPLPLEISLSLFRVLQEALHNAAKHSGVAHFEVRLWGESGEIHLEVRDFGVGFDTGTAMKGPGLGLTSMQERIRLVHGEFSINSQPTGTTVRARVPLKSESYSKRAGG